VRIIVAEAGQPREIVVHPHVVAGLGGHAEGVAAGGDGVHGDEVGHWLVGNAEGETGVEDAFAHGIFFEGFEVAVVEGSAGCGGEVREGCSLVL